MSDILCITNRNICTEDFLTRIERIAMAGPRAIVLREKNLSRADYKELAIKVTDICRKYSTPCILHSFADIAIELKSESLHLPLPLLRQLSREDKEHFKVLGASCHSTEEASEAEKLGCTYITSGHIFNTDCKKGLPGRGLDFLEKVCRSISIPVYAIGGIDHTNFAEVRMAGAAGACVMSGIMRCDNVNMYLDGFKYEV